MKTLTNIIQPLKIVILAIILSLGISFAYAWTAPTVGPPDGNTIAPINTSVNGQIKDGGLRIKQLLWGSSNVLLATDANTNVGIGTATPVSRLHTVGDVAITGTGTISSSATTVTGVNTIFSTQLNIGDVIIASGQTRVVTGITSGFSLTIDKAFLSDLSTVTFTFQKPITILANSVGSTKLILNSLGNVGIGTAAPTATLNISGSSAIAVALAVDTYTGNGTTANSIAFRTARGTQSDPQPSLSRDQIGFFGARGFGSTAFAVGSRASIGMSAAEHWTDINQGTFMTFRTTPNGASTIVDRVTIDNAGNVGIGTIAPSGILSVTPFQSNTGTASQAGNIVSGSGTAWTSAMVGSQLVFSNGVSAGTITAFASATSLTVSSLQAVATMAYSIAHTGLQVGTNGKVGIGTVSPVEMLDVKGNINANKYCINGVCESGFDKNKILQVTLAGIAGTLVTATDKTYFNSYRNTRNGRCKINPTKNAVSPCFSRKSPIGGNLYPQSYPISICII